MAMSSPKASEYSLQGILRSEHGTLAIGGTRAVLTTRAAYVLMMKILHEHAPHALNYAFYDMGYRVGEELMGALAGAAGDPERAFRYLVETFKQAGYGDLAVESLDMSLPEAKLAGTNLFEVEVARASGIYRTPRSVDHYSRGMFAGFMSSLVGKEVSCEEVACQFRGDDRCEFVILPFNS